MPFNELSNLPYLNSVVDEALRLWPAAPGSLYRLAPLTGYRFAFNNCAVPGNTCIATQAWTFHQDASIFRDPQSFNPDRWRNPTAQMHEAFMPFGADARICIGMQMARMKLLHGAFAFFRACPDAVAVSSADDMRPVDYFLMKPKVRECLITLG